MMQPIVVNSSPYTHVISTHCCTLLVATPHLENVTTAYSR